MFGIEFHELRPERDQRSAFERLLEVFTEVITHTSGDVAEALDWMRALDDQYGLTEPDYTLDDFIEELKAKGYLREATGPGKGGIQLGSRGEQHMRRRALDQIFGNLRKGAQGRHRTKERGQGDEPNEDRRPYRFGDKLDQVDFGASLRNAQIHHGPGARSGRGGFRMTEDDLVVEDREHRSTTSTVLMIDISHSMILYSPGARKRGLRGFLKRISVLFSTSNNF